MLYTKRDGVLQVINCKESGRIEDPATRGMMDSWSIGILDIKSENFLFLISGFETHYSNTPLFQFSSSTD